MFNESKSYLVNLSRHRKRISLSGYLVRFTRVLLLYGFTSLFLSSSIAAHQDLNDPQEVIKAIEKLNWVTEEYPPFNYLDPETGEATGASVDILIKIFEKIGVNLTAKDLKIYPWARGYHQVLNDSGSALFSTTYTMERLQIMKFVGPVVPNNVAVIAPKSRHLKINSASDLNQLKTSVVRDDIGEQLLIKQGVKVEAIDQLNSGLSMVKKLAAGRVDAIAYAHVTALRLFEQANIDPNDFEVVYILTKSNMGYTFHNTTDARILEPMQKALDELTVDGTLVEVQAKYGINNAL